MSVPRSAWRALGRRRAIYLLPNIVTSFALIAGFYSIAKTIEGNYKVAVYAIILGSLLDLIDGRLARWTGSQSQFGAEYDSLSDVIVFGVAPAVLALQSGLHSLGQIGFAVLLVYVLAAAGRLARFNVTAGEDRRFFNGLPTPVAGIIAAASTHIALPAGDEIFSGSAMVVAAMLLVLAFTMVSSLKYYSFNDMNLKMRLGGAGLYLVPLVIAVFTMLVLEYGTVAIGVCALLYLVSGYVLWLRSFYRRARRTNRSIPASVLKDLKDFASSLWRRD